jgi:hypothetical protein
VIKDVDNLKKYITNVDNEYIVYTKSEFLKYVQTGKIINYLNFNVKIEKDLTVFVDNISKDLFTKNRDYIDGVMQTQNKTKKVYVANPIDYHDDINNLVSQIYNYFTQKRKSYYNTYKLMCVSFGKKNVQ